MKIHLVTAEAFKKQVADGEDIENTGIIKDFVQQAKIVDEKNLIADFIVSSKTVDRDRDTIDPSGWDFKNWKKNPVVLFGHNSRDLPIARGKSIRVNEKGQVVSRAQFTDRDLNPFGYTVFRMVKEGFLNTSSVGFIPLKWEMSDDEDRKYGYDFSKQELTEWSVVPVPSNPEAIVQAHMKGIDTAPLRDWATKILDEDTKGFSVDMLENAWKRLREDRDYFFLEIKDEDTVHEPSGGDKPELEDTWKGLSDEDKDDIAQRVAKLVSGEASEGGKDSDGEVSDEVIIGHLESRASGADSLAKEAIRIVVAHLKGEEFDVIELESDDPDIGDFDKDDDPDIPIDPSTLKDWLEDSVKRGISSKAE